ncbi:MAG: type I-U CRISPR-associated protein Cas5/Cas6 [Planctomycetes bacterium]|nr:type I-U CRISPR-associated protein Cas5/Cas6 [Planctomycetota bacterium]
MIFLELRFPAGRYHATPWGRHVNEGAIEWPPSPWRLLRALLAVGFTKLGWSETGEVPPLAQSMIEALASTPPVYRLPKASTAHTRHYMPQYKGSTSKVLDAFAWIGREASLGVEWDVDLEAEQLAVLDQLLERLTYLGRAESWVEASRVDALGHGQRCAASKTAPTEGWERVPTLAPEEPAAYQDWREDCVANVLAEELSETQRRAQEKGKKIPSKLSKSKAAKLVAHYPSSIFEALFARTSELQSARWSQPPGTRWLSYWRIPSALSARPAPVGGLRRQGHDPRVVLLALTPDTEKAAALPLARTALWQGERLHAAWVRRACDDGQEPSSCLTGRTQGRHEAGHGHAHVLPLCLGRTGKLDHILIYARAGLDRQALAALRRVRKTYGAKLPPIFVSFVGQGQVTDLAAHVPQLRSSETWVSVTPFVPPRYLKKQGKNALLGQVRAELESRGIEGLAALEFEIAQPGLGSEGSPWLDAESFWVAKSGDPSLGTNATARLSTRWRHFRRERQKGDRRPPQSIGLGLRLTFAKEVQGPIALGYGSHFGLGQFVPA